MTRLQYDRFPHTCPLCGAAPHDVFRVTTGRPGGGSIDEVQSVRYECGSLIEHNPIEDHPNLKSLRPDDRCDN